MGVDGADVLHCRELPPVRRRLLADIRAHHVEADAAYDAALVMAELVTNALRHARPLDDGRLKLTWGCWDDLLHVHVTDGGGNTEPVIAMAEQAATRGRGLAIVRDVSTEWGVEHRTATTTVWASLPAPFLSSTALPARQQQSHG